jgi:hypothetical protein
MNHIVAAKQQSVSVLLAALLAVPALGLLVPAAFADPITPEVHAKVDKYKKQITEWAANPTIVQAVKEANAKGPIAGMSNAKWDELDEKDPVVQAMLNSPAGKLGRKWEEDKNINKVTVWDEKGNVIAGSVKTLIYNAASRPAFTGAMKGQAWSAPEAKPDPATQKKSVNISAPVLDGGKTIGVVNAAVSAE